MTVLQAGEDYSVFAYRFIVEGLFPFMGSVVKTSLAKLEDEGFTKEEALFYLEELTIVQLYRMNFPLPPVSISVYVPDPKVYTEYEIMAMAARGETIPQAEYTGFEGTR